MTIDWRDISYLASGTPRQRSAYANLRALGILESLRSFDAVLVSTVNTDIDIASSDLDIICEAHDLISFEERARELFGGMRAFTSRRSSRTPEAFIISFFFEEWEYEIFGQGVPVTQQEAYRHLVQTHRVVSRGGERWRESIRSLKRRGIKTEPAVAHTLGLSGDPYRAVLSLELVSDSALDEMLARGPRGEP